jgi:membrane protease YdiL (CAAX protease family)
MLTYFLAFYLLVVLPVLPLLGLRRTTGDVLPSALMRRYGLRGVEVLILLAVLWIACVQAGHTPAQIGLAFPSPGAGMWWLGFSLLLVMSLYLADNVLARRQTPEARAEFARNLLDSPVPWPQTGKQTLAFALSAALITAAWEILYRGFILLLLTPTTGLPIAILASSIAYGVAHGYQNPKKLISSIFSALAFTIAYALTHSLWWLIVIHAAVPLMALPAVSRARGKRESEFAKAPMEPVQVDKQ